MVFLESNQSLSSIKASISLPGNPQQSDPLTETTCPMARGWAKLSTQLSGRPQSNSLINKAYRARLLDLHLHT
jgi:hypothetical protein